MKQSFLTKLFRQGRANLSAGGGKLDVALALSKRGELDLHYIQAEIKVLAERAGTDCRFQIEIGGGDDADQATDHVLVLLRRSRW